MPRKTKTVPKGSAKSGRHPANKSSTSTTKSAPHSAEPQRTRSKVGSETIVNKKTLPKSADPSSTSALSAAVAAAASKRSAAARTKNEKKQSTKEPLPSKSAESAKGKNIQPGKRSRSGATKSTTQPRRKAQRPDDSKTPVAPPISHRDAQPAPLDSASAGSMSIGAPAPPASSSLLGRYLQPSAAAPDTPWSAMEAVVFSTFLAQLQFSFVRSCCQLLSTLTTSSSPAFLHVAALGEAALGASTSTGAHGAAADAATDTPPPPGQADQLADRQEQAFRTIRATIAASCTLGHRSCQVLWGPRGSGKHRILRLLADDVRRTPNSFVVELHGQLLRDDEAALGVIAQQLFTFLRSPQSQELRAAHYLLRHGSFGFGQLFHFERRMQEAEAVTEAAPNAAPHEPAVVGGVGAAKARTSAAVARKLNRRRVGQRRKEASLSSSSDDDESNSASSDGDESDTEGGDAGLMVTSTTTYLTGGAASALPHLQRALLLLKSVGCSIVVCIRDIDVFGIRCDQLLYVLSGLMHDGDGSGGGGGLSLVLASAAPDIRQLEKRLSSRLTCETRYVPLLPWSLTGVLAATLHLSAQEASFQTSLRELTRERAELLVTLRERAAQLRRSLEARAATAGKVSARKASKKAAEEEEAAMAELRGAMAAMEARLHVTEARLRDVRAQRRHFLGFLDADPAASFSTVSGGGVTNGGGGGAVLFGGATHTSTGAVSTSGWRQTSSARNTSAVPSAQPSPSTTAAATVRANVVAARSWSVQSLAAHPSLSLEVQCVLCEELLRQLRATHNAGGAHRGVRDARSDADTASSKADPLPASQVAGNSLVQQIVALNAELELESSTSSTVLTVLASALCKAASGAVDLLGPAGRRVLLRWMRARLQHVAIPPSGEAAVDAVSPSACPPGLPEKILCAWRESAQVMVASGAKTDGVRREAPSSTFALQPPFSLPPLSGTSATPMVAASFSAPPAEAGASVGNVFTRANAGVALPPLSLLPPHLFDLFAEGQLVGMGYGSREMMLVLFYMHLHHTTGVRQRTVADLLEDVSSSLGTRAAAALDREAFRHAIRLLCRWRLLAVVESHSQTVQLCGSDARLREFLTTVLSKQPTWCEAELGLDAREIMRFRNLV